MKGTDTPIAQTLASRIGFRVLLTVLLVMLAVTMFIFETDTALMISFAAALISFVSAYLITQFLINKRIDNLANGLESLGGKNFLENKYLNQDNNDELDNLATKLVRVSNTIEREFQRLERLEDYRKEFIGDISHELKTPIFAIQGFVETLLDGALEDESVNREFLSKTMKNVNRLTLLTRDLMEISRLETGELKPQLQSIYLKEAIQEVMETLAYKAERENVHLIANDVHPGLRVIADKNQLRQVLINLIENAIKYNKPDGRVTVGVYPYAPRDLKMWIYVKDTGIGIDEQDIPRVTERFFRVDKSRSREKGGTGLGLAIVKHILESQGDQLRVTSEAGKGSVFSFCLQNADRISG